MYTHIITHIYLDLFDSRMCTSLMLRPQMKVHFVAKCIFPSFLFISSANELV
uniref:Uncharacterized protein n=1 Tax=Anguilla anguilla TaxID=7936 RepID=A0A0E9PAR7_ANGAN